MASLLDTLKANKDKSKQTSIGPNGQLLSSSTVGIQQQAASSGQYVPTQPLSAAGLTGNPDQAKMAGTPNQLAGAQSANLNTDGKTLSEYSQTGFKADQATQDELNKQAQVKQLEQLGELAPRVQSIINQSIKQAADSGSNPSLIAKSGLSPELTDSLNKFAQGDKSQLPKIAKSLGKDSLDLTYDDLKALYADQDSAVIDSIVKQVPDSIKVSPSLLGPDVNIQDLGQTLGLNVEDLSISQLNDALTQFFNKQQFNIEQLKARARSPNTGAAERAEIYDHLRQLGVTGEEGIAQRAGELEEDVNQGLSVTIDGKTYTTDELLNDQTFGNLVKEYLTNPNGTAAQELAKFSPDLINFVNQNRDALTAAAKQTEETTASVKDIIRENRNLPVINGGQSINKELMDSVLGPDWENSTEKIDLSSLPALAFMKDPKADPGKVAALSVSLNQLYDLNPGIAKQAMGMSPAELERLGLTLSPNHPDSAIHVYKLAMGLHDNIGKVDWSDPEKALEQLLQEDMPDGATNQLFSDYGFAKAAGLAKSDPTIESLLDLKYHPEKYANLDPNNLSSIYDLLKGSKLTGASGAITSAANKISNNESVSALRPYMANDFLLDANEASKVASSLGETKALNLFAQLSDASFGGNQEKAKQVNNASLNVMYSAAQQAGIDPIRTYNIILDPTKGTQADLNNLNKLINALSSVYESPEYNAEAKAAIAKRLEQAWAASEKLSAVVEAKKRADNAERERQEKAELANKFKMAFAK